MTQTGETREETLIFVFASATIGDKYYQYEFKQQPSHEECVQMSRSSPSVLFTRYTDLFCDQTWEDLFAELFGEPCKALMCSSVFCITLILREWLCTAQFMMRISLFSVSSHHTGARYISRDWQGIRTPVDATMVGRVYLSPKPTPSSPPPSMRRGSRKRRPSRRRGHRGRHSRHVLFDDLWGYDDWFDFSDYSDLFDERTTVEQKSTPVQNVYFFKKGMNIWDHFYPLTWMYLTTKTLHKLMTTFIIFNLQHILFSSSLMQINTTEWICRPNVWTQSTLLTHDPLQNTGWAARRRIYLIHQEQRRNKPADEVCSSKN